ncbi:methylamine utilization protein MauE, partial [Streptomyces triticirhizae]
AAGPAAPPEGAAEWATAALAAASLTALLWSLPAALAQPAAPERPLPTVAVVSVPNGGR